MLIFSMHDVCHAFTIIDLQYAHECLTPNIVEAGVFDKKGFQPYDGERRFEDRFEVDLNVFVKFLGNIGDFTQTMNGNQSK